MRERWHLRVEGRRQSDENLPSRIPDDVAAEL